jgi:ABC-type multidrug transport system fused ATPase/permease subunit
VAISTTFIRNIKVHNETPIGSATTFYKDSKCHIHIIRVILLHAAEVSCWMVTGERQAARIRSLYLKTILKQDIAFFDTETNTGEIIGRMSGDTILIQDAMGEKVYIFNHLH